MTYKFLDLTGLKQTITQIFSKLKAVALSGSYTDLINKPTIVNNGTTTTTNTVLDGRMGKTLADKDANLQSQITSLNSALTGKSQVVDTGWTSYGMINVPVGLIAILFVTTENGEPGTYLVLSNTGSIQILNVFSNAHIVIVPYNSDRYISIRNNDSMTNIRAIALSSGNISKK